MHLTIVGGGWAGLSAAVRAVQRGWAVTLWEASRQLGGRARSLEHRGRQLDNGQHILIGAYTETLALMQTLGVRPEDVLRRQALTVLRPDGSGFRLPDVPPPWNLLIGVLRAPGWGWQDRWSLLGTAIRWQRQHFACPAQATVADVCASLTARVMDELIEPLCVSALNTPPRAASGAVFLRVLRDALFSGTGGSDLLLPTTDLGAVLPDAALHWLQQRGVVIRLGQRWESDSSTSSFTVLACPAWEAARLTRDRHPGWSAQAHALQHAAITTVYVQHPDPGFRLPQPMLALPSDARRPVQFVFDRGQLLGPSQHGLLACVVSDSSGTREALERQVLAQLHDQLSDSPGHLNGDDWRVVQTVMEKRATFVCSPKVERPSPVIGSGWWACGDYVSGPYPATLEGAVRSGREVIDQIAQACEREGRL
jgi:squalene-associated FAD-dependent desaturase